MLNIVISVGANMVMEDLVFSSLQKITFCVPFSKAYADDTMFALASSKSSDVLRVFSS